MLSPTSEMPLNGGENQHFKSCHLSKNVVTMEVKVMQTADLLAQCGAEGVALLPNGDQLRAELTAEKSHKSF